jgi:hypothetical protein
MPATEVCATEDFVAEATPQPASLEEAASTQEILIQQVEGYLNRLREAMCNDLNSLQVQLDACDCSSNGGGGGLPDLVDDVEISSGREFNGFPTFFKMRDVGPLPNAATKTVAHNIVPAAPFVDFIVVAMYGSGNDLIAPKFAIPLNSGTTSFTTNNIFLFTDPTNINIVAGINRSNYTTAFVVLEYYYA